LASATQTIKVSLSHHLDVSPYRLVALHLALPDFGWQSHSQKTLAVNIPQRGSQRPLHQPIDSADMQSEDEGEWHGREHRYVKS